ncbi:MAG: hypothetical protein CMQ30_07330 [Gammaproteobacteria bacterium]|nr:hypothetical protein [Gammaproteobacteria bacterium]
MKKQILKAIFSIFGALIAIASLVVITGNPGKFGEYSLFARACLVNLVIVACLIALLPFWSPLLRMKRQLMVLMILTSWIPAFIFYLLILPSRAVNELDLDQQDSSLLSDRSSNGIIEIGFQYPIFTPTISLVNRDAFTRDVTIFLRLIDRNKESALFRAVRLRSDSENLSVESTIRGMLSTNLRYLFNPIKLPPGESISGRPVFIITNLEDGASFTEALGNGYTGSFELRDADEGNLLADFPLEPI